jgi:AcrR family transcriptional regulator
LTSFEVRGTIDTFTIDGGAEVMPKRALNDQPKSDQKILSIATAAAKLFSSKGYIETSGEDIAAAAKMSKSAMYYYFNNKSDILYFIVSTFLDAVLKSLQQDIEVTKDPAERLRLIIFRHIKTYVDHMYLAKTLLKEAHNLPSAKLRKIQAKERQYFDAISKTILSYAGHDMDKNKLTILTFNLLGMCNWNYAWYNPKGVVSGEELSQMIFDIFTGSFWNKETDCDSFLKSIKPHFFLDK